MTVTTQIQWTEASGSTTVLDTDAVVTETNAMASEITDNPIELGADVTDNARDKSDQLTLEFVISNTPTRVPKSHANGVTGSTRATPDGKAVVLQFDAQFDRVQAVQQDLARVKKAALLWQITTALRIYGNFLLEQINVTRDGKTGNSAKFSLQLRRALFVSTQYAAVPVLQPRTLPTATQSTQPTRTPHNGILARLTGATGHAVLPSSGGGS